MARGHVEPNGQKVARLRGEAGLTQADMAARAGFGLRTISKVESSQPTTALTLSAIATVLSRKLQRPIALGDLLLPTAERSQLAHDLVVAEQVKLLDLRRWGSTRGRLAELIDHHRFRRLPEHLAEIMFQYGTTGTGLRGQCRSHPDRYEWSAVPPNGHWPRLNLEGVLRLRLDARMRAAGCEVSNTVEYLDGFAGEEREWFHALVSHPTESLTVLVLFPEEKPFRKLHGLCRHCRGEGFVPVHLQPLGLQEGRLGWWRISEARVGEIYRLEWEW